MCTLTDVIKRKPRDAGLLLSYFLSSTTGGFIPLPCSLEPA
jgi:hypothetical protein